MQIVRLLRAIQAQRNADVGARELIYCLSREQKAIGLHADVQLHASPYRFAKLSRESHEFSATHEQGFATMEDNDGTSYSGVPEV